MMKLTKIVIPLLTNTKEILIIYLREYTSIGM